jgi:hypothetical protein
MRNSTNLENHPNQYSALKQALQPHLGWHGARISFLVLFLLALLKVKTVNLSELAVGFGGKALKESNYKRYNAFSEISSLITLRAPKLSWVG